MGARGADAALEQAEIVLMNDRLENFLAAFRLSQNARSVIGQNLIVSLGTVAVLGGDGDVERFGGAEQLAPALYESPMPSAGDKAAGGKMMSTSPMNQGGGSGRKNLPVFREVRKAWTTR